MGGHYNNILKCKSQCNQFVVDLFDKKGCVPE